MSIDKKTGDISDLFENEPNVTHKKSVFDDDFEITYEDSVFDDGFEVTYEDDSAISETELNMDAYKDVLSILNELDETGSMDYLEANRTRTINLDESYEYSTNTQKNDILNHSEEPFTNTAGNNKTERNGRHRGLSGYFEDLFKKHD